MSTRTEREQKRLDTQRYMRRCDFHRIKEGKQPIYPFPWNKARRHLSLLSISVQHAVLSLLIR
jgi:hypothetical protein